VPLGAGYGAAAVGVDASGNAVFAWTADGDPDEHGHIHTVVQTRTLRADGSLTPVLTLTDPTASAGSPEVAVAPNGDATFAYTKSHPPFLGMVKTRTLKANGNLTRPQVLAAAAFGVRVGVDAEGDATFVWDHVLDSRTEVIQVRRRTTAGALGAVVTLGPGTRSIGEPTVAVDARDDAAFIWRTFTGTDSNNSDNKVVEARMRKPDGTLTPRTTISEPGASSVGSFDVGIDNAGNATFAWQRSGIAQARRRSGATGAYRPTVDLSAAGTFANYVGVAVAPTSGDAVFAWMRDAGSIDARRLTPTGTLSPIVQVAH
jgi:hypothetical protein